MLSMNMAYMYEDAGIMSHNFVMFFSLCIWTGMRRSI